MDLVAAWPPGAQALFLAGAVASVTGATFGVILAQGAYARAQHGVEAWRARRAEAHAREREARLRLSARLVQFHPVRARPLQHPFHPPRRG